MKPTLIITSIILLAIYAVLQIYAGFIGVQHHLGSGWASVAVVAAFLYFPLPLTVGSFFGAMDVWGWNWFAALLFAAPLTVLWLASFFLGTVGQIFGRK